MNLRTIASAASVGGAACAAVYYATYAVRSQVLGATDWHGRRDTNAVALTFDDGPGMETGPVLDALAAYGATATFFVIGARIKRYPALVRRMVADGHEVGNHSYSHPIYLYRSSRHVRQQLERTQAAITEIANRCPRFARPPCGVRTLAYFRAARRLHLRTVQWEVTGFDWRLRDGKSIAREVVGSARAGSIVLLHDGDSQNRSDRCATVAAVPLIIEGLRQRGLTIARLSQLLMLGDEAHT